MLRFLFQEPPRTDSGLMLEAGNAVRTYIAASQKKAEASQGNANKHHRLAIWSQGFLDALNELEQSHYCSENYAKRIHSQFLEDMNVEELNDYRRFVYFYKNTFLRVFSILDKLGYFLDELLNLRTEEMKPRFSYFTVLRRLRERNDYAELEQQLYKLKVESSKPLDRLRNQRNTETHFINAEMLDDLNLREPVASRRIHVESAARNVQDIHTGFEMVCRTLVVVFTYITARLAKE
ncbi:Cthe_2314 family HEPN domain-containing protein [Paenibacillus eucommiae]|uniref:Cthe-2314-like HEPN domain-containing protein n=1 Tax=Paenibacillus eucommiae TaxID=1355755 RepID=A0ABS4IWR0_9BACL|nr:Cthe_2314 family HEPN domain-containing protein [Paenibacillus eucommiae]MBP1992022.1 hypothetical protein [Paenibacillus eucommiae]